MTTPRPRLAIVALHGVGSASRGYSRQTERRVVTDLESRGWLPGSVVWREVCWGAALAQAQARYLAAAGSAGPLTRVVVEMAGDALALIGPGLAPVLEQIRGALDEAGREAQMTAVVAHSLGGVLAWHALASPELAERCGAVCLLGSPLAAAMLGSGAHRLPLLGEARSAAPWLAIRDSADPLGLPLSMLAGGARDALVDVGGAPWVDATALAHTGYWSSREVAARAATHLDSMRR